MNPKIFLFLVLLSFFAGIANSANILIFHNVASYSHRVVSYPLANALADKGHHVTLITPYHPREKGNPKIKEIVPKQLETTMGMVIESEFDINFRVQKLLPYVVFQFFPIATVLCEAFLSSPELEGYLKTTKSLDLLIIDSCYAECATAIAYKYKAKIIVLSTVLQIASDYDLYGFGPESSAIPEGEINPYRTPMSFWQRVVNTMQALHYRYEHYKYMKVMDQLTRKYLDVPQMPFLDDVAGNVSLVFYTGDIISDYSRSQPPLFVNIGGIHCRPGKPLPIGLENFINGSNLGGGKNDGFVYISLGSVVLSSKLPEEIKQVFFSTMESNPQLRFLWKWDGQVPKKIPKNLYLAPWFPQQDVLAHPKIKAFVTQSGRPSIQESLYNAVPMISFPSITDQDFNSDRVNDMGANVILELGTVTLKEFKDAVQKVVYDQRMKKRMEVLRNIFIDRPQTPLDTAVWWTEYVLRHPDTSHLRPSGSSQMWYQRRLVDVWAFLTLAVFFSFIFIITSFLCFCKCFKNRITSQTSSPKRDKGKKMKAN